MSTFRNTDPIRVTVAPGVIFDLTPRCGQCGDREGMDTLESVARGLCCVCDPDALSACDGCFAEVPNRCLTEVGDRDLCAVCRVTQR